MPHKWRLIVGVLTLVVATAAISAALIVLAPRHKDLIVVYSDQRSPVGDGRTWEQDLNTVLGLEYRNISFTTVSRVAADTESGNVAIAQGGVQLRLARASVIPAGATAPLRLTLRANAALNLRTIEQPLTIGGVRGTFQTGAWKHHHFTAGGWSYDPAHGATAGAAFIPRTRPNRTVRVPAGAALHLSRPAARDQHAIQIIWVGRNDIESRSPNAVNGTVSAVRAMVRHLTSIGNRHFLVISVLALGPEDDQQLDGGGARTRDHWERIHQINSRLQALYPKNYVNLLGYIVNNASTIAQKAHITLASTDMAALRDGTVPGSFITGGTVLNAAVSNVAVTALLSTTLQGTGWLNAG